jgi:hypothetical protein
MSYKSTDNFLRFARFSVHEIRTNNTILVKKYYNTLFATN